MDPENNTNPTPTPAGNPAAAATPNVTNSFDSGTTTNESASPAADLASAAAELTSSLDSGTPLDNASPATDPLVSTSTPAAPAPTPAPAPAPASIFGAAAPATPSAFGTPASPTPAPAPTPAPEAPVAPAPEQPAAEEQPSDDDPIEPAAPVPGSLGSAQSYSDIEAAEAEAAAKAAGMGQKNKNNKTTIIMLAVLGVIIVVAIIVAIVMINGGKKTANNNNGGGNTDPTPVAPSVIDTKNLICSREASAEEVAQLSATSADTSITVEYEEEEMTSFSEVTNATYADHLSAEGGKSVIMESYGAALNLNGLASDPFDSTYVIVDTNGNDGSSAGGAAEVPDEIAEGEEGGQTNPLQTVDNPEGTIVRATHLATPTTLDVSSAVMFGLSADSDGNVDTSLSSIEKIYAARGYTCQAQ